VEEQLLGQGMCNIHNAALAYRMPYAIT